MSDEVREVSFEEALVNRLAQRLGMLQAQLEMAQLNLEIKDQEIARLTQQLQDQAALLMPEYQEPPMGPPTLPNGDSTVSTEGGTDDDLRQPRPDVPRPESAAAGAQGGGVRAQGDQEGQ